MDDQSHIVAAEAAVTAALEPPRRRLFSRRRKAQPPALPYCENCGAPMAGPFCAQCGQAAIDYRRSFRHDIVDVLDSFLNWDSKFFATIGLLIVKPWRLTNEFLAGRRVRYLHPLRLYLLASILFFFAVNYGARGLRMEPGKFKLNEKDRAELKTDLKNSDLLPEARDQLQSLLNESSPAPSAATPSPALSPLIGPSASAAPATAAPSPKQTVRSYGPVTERPFVIFDADTKPSTPF